MTKLNKTSISHVLAECAAIVPKVSSVSLFKGFTKSCPRLFASVSMQLEKDCLGVAICMVDLLCASMNLKDVSCYIRELVSSLVSTTVITQRCTQHAFSHFSIFGGKFKCAHVQICFSFTPNSLWGLWFMCPQWQFFFVWNFFAKYKCEYNKVNTSTNTEQLFTLMAKVAQHDLSL